MRTQFLDSRVRVFSRANTQGYSPIWPAFTEPCLGDSWCLQTKLQVLTHIPHQPAQLTVLRTQEVAVDPGDRGGMVPLYCRHPWGSQVVGTTEKAR